MLLGGIGVQGHKRSIGEDVHTLLKGNRRSRHGLSKPELFTTGRILTALWVLALVIIVTVVLFGPERKPVPKLSTVSFEAKPARDHTVGDFASDDHGKRSRDREALMGKMVEYSKGRFVVQATVKSTSTGKPIESAFVSGDFQGAPPEGTELTTMVRRFGTYTDVSGHCTLHVEYPGKYVFNIARSGYLQCPAQEAELTDDAPRAEVVFELSQGAKIKGRVTEKVNGKGAPGVEVVATGDTWGRAKTDAEGNYTISGLAQGTYDVSLDLSGTVYLTGGKLPSQEVKLDDPDATASDIDFKVEAGGVVWGYITTKEGEPVKDAGVLLCTSASIASQLIDTGLRAASMAGEERKISDQQRLGVVAAQTDDKGYYELLGVGLNKEWRVITMGPETAPQLSDPFMLSQNQRTVRVDLTLVSGTTVYGRVVTPTGEAVETAEIACIPGFSKLFSPLDRPQAFRTTRSAADGTFELPHIPRGDYQIMAMKQGYKFLLTGTPISPDGYNDLRGVEITLTPVEAGQSVVFGTVTDGSGAPVSGVKVDLANMNIEALQPQEMSETTDANGYYQFDGVSSGVLALHLTKTGYADKVTTDVRLDAATDIVIEAQSRVSGRVVVYETGQAAAGASVRAIKTASSESGAQGSGSQGAGFAGLAMPNMADSLSSFDTRPCNENGEFDFALAPGSYILEGRARGMAPGRTTITISPGQTASNIDIKVRQSGGRIQGRVVTSTGKTPDGAQVWVREGGASDLPSLMQDIASQLPDVGQRSVRVGSDGAFDFTSLGAGSYVVCARLEGFAQGQSAPVTLTDGQAVSGIDVRLSSGGSLEGYVSVNGQLTAGVFVILGGDTGKVAMATTDNNGRYHIDNIRAGNYVALAVSLGGGTGLGALYQQSARVDIVDGRPTTHNFGESTNTSLAGLCTPPPAGGIGFAFLHQPGGSLDPAQIDLRNPAAWLTGSGGIGGVGMAPIDREGAFRMDSIAEGNYVLEVFYTSMNDILSGRVRKVFSGPVTITNGQTAEMNVTVSE